MVVQKVVDDLMKRLRHRTVETLRGALDRQRRTRRPRHGDVDWPRTIGANLKHYQAEHRTIVPERSSALPASRGPAPISTM
jgi:hypothetical protein